jgi:predicted Zn-dependent protease
MDAIERFENLLASGKDGPLVRFGLGQQYLQAGRADKAVEHLTVATTQDPRYSAAWKLLGKALADSGRRDEAKDVYRRGIAVAEEKGDKQAAKEMAVFLRRLERPPPA